MQLPVELAQAVEQIADHFDSRNLATAAAQVSNKYREGKDWSFANDAQRAAYLIARLPATFAAVSAAMLQAANALPDFAPASMLDLGAGPGTAAWAAATIFPTLARFNFIERDAGMVQLGQRLVSASSCPGLRTSAWALGDAATPSPQESFDLVVLAYVLGEIEPRRRSQMLERAWAECSAVMLVVEPGTPRGYRNILDVRQQLLAAGAHMVAPCPHERACPLALAADDWCHFAQRVERSALHRRMKSGTLGHEDEKFSYAAFSRSTAQPTEARILRHPQIGKGHIKLELCARAGLEKTTITRSQKELFRVARKAHWGDAWPPKP